MRKLILTISIAMAAMLLTQCRKSEVPQTGEQPVPTFKVTLNATNNGGDKSEFDGYKVKWNAGDKLYVVDVDVTPAVLLGYLSAETDGTLVDG